MDQSAGTEPQIRGFSAPRPLQVLPPDVRRLPGLLSDPDPAQSRALRVIEQGRDLLLPGAPGSGRTSLVLTAALAAARAAGAGPAPLGTEETLVLVARRAPADALRDAVALAGAAASVRVATPAAYAFSVVRAESRERGTGEPTLVTGAEQDALLADLIAQRPDWAVEVEPAARTLPGFRAELRDVITRAEELGLLPRDLRALAAQRGRAAWFDAAALLEDYLDVLDLQSASALDAGPRLDSGALVRRAADLLGGLPPALLPRRVLVDDAQDLTAAGIALVLALARAGAQLLVTSCPDEMVDSFRGALPDAAARIAAAAPRPLEQIVLASSWRSRGTAAAGIAALRARLPIAGQPLELRRPQPAPTGQAAPTEQPAPTGQAEPEEALSPRATALGVLTAADPLEEARLIASVLRDTHHREQVPYDDMAVLCRSGGIVEQVADLLARSGLPVTTPQRLPALREEPVVADLLRIVELGAAAASGRTPQLSPEDAAALLRGPFGDADALRLRRIRRMLLDHERTAAGSGSQSDSAGSDSAGSDSTGADSQSDSAGADQAARASAELLAAAIVSPEEPGLPAPGTGNRTATPVHRLRRMVAAVRDLGPAPAAALALWAAWEAAALAEGWQQASLGLDRQRTITEGDARARLMARRLDAVSALFAAADRFTDRRPQADALVFIDQVRSQAVAEDTLAPRAEARGRVAVLTPAQLAGFERDTVVLARVQEGAWPNARLRSTLFGASELSLLWAQGRTPRSSQEVPLEGAPLRALQREQVIADELRLAVSALARGRSRVLVTAVDGGDLAPSVLLDLLRPHADARWPDPALLTADPGPAPDPRRLVAALRRRLESEDPRARTDAAILLARLAGEGVEGADPRTWYHQLPSSESPLRPDAETPVRLSPSSLERAHDCPQAWLLERAGGSRSAGAPQLIGTAIHALAQENPGGAGPGGVPDLLLRLQSLLRPLRLEETWSGRRRLRQAEDAVRLLEQYLAHAAPAIATEVPFAVRIGPVDLRGIMDRLEGEKEVRVVDLKTGRAPKSAAAAAEDLQLASYQTAVAAGSLEEVLGPDAGERLAGAQLVYVGTGGAKPAVRTQAALPAAEDPRWFETIAQKVAADVSGSQVRARRNPHCDRCAVRRTCALWPEGAQL